jgi:hypothetical protein
MGVSHVFTISEDGLVPASQDNQEAAEKQLGKAVLQLALKPEYEIGLDGTRQRVSHASLGSQANCVNWVSEAHSSQTEIYAWLGNCLRPIRVLKEADLQEVRRLVDEEIRRRQK